MTESSARLSNTQDLFNLSDEHREVLDVADKFARNELGAPRHPHGCGRVVAR